MNELSRHIEYLLLSHDCVAIPQLGAFVTQWIDASCADEEALFLPPQRSIRFNTDIRTDDGLLVRSIQRTYHFAENEAKHKVQTLVLGLRQQLLTDGVADFGALGQFTQDDDGVLTFEACTAGAVAPTHFGLDAFVFPRLQHNSKARLTRRHEEPTAQPRLFSITSHEGDIDIHIGHRLVRNVGVAAALAVLFFLLPTHMGMTGLFTPSTATLNPIGHEPATAVVAQSQAPAAPAPVAATTAEPAAPTEPSAATTAIDAPAQTQPTYAVVLACAIPEQKAERYAAELTAKGLSGVRVMKHGKMVRVVMDGFLSEARAREEISTLREQSAEFASAWVMKIDK